MKSYTVADLFLESLALFVALSAADGFARLTKRPQCVIVHVDVGTAALGQGLHNASSGRAPVLIFAGQAPLTLHGELPGSRSEHVQWYQDVPNQHAIVAPYARYTAELKHAAHTRTIVRRALAMSVATSPGPVYLTATREVLAAPADPAFFPDEPSSSSSSSLTTTAPQPPPSSTLGALPPHAVTTIATALLAADSPLVVTGYLGRSNGAVHALVALASIVRGLRVFDAEFREMSFPATHRAAIHRSTGAAAAIKGSDVILLLDVDVPWIPTKVRPERRDGGGVRIFHVDCDPRKEKMGLFDVGADEESGGGGGTWAADAGTALEQLCEWLRGPAGAGMLAERAAAFDRRWEELGRRHEEGCRLLAEKARPAAASDGRLTPAALFAALRRALPQDTIWVSDVVTNQVALSEQLALQVPGTNFTKGGSGLGWSGGAAVGIKIATELYDTANERPCVNRRAGGRDGKGRFICSITGDGSFIFGAPSAVYWAQHQHQTPFLTVIVNNGGWKATRSCINDVHPDGLAAKTSDHGLGIDLRGNGPDYLGIAKSAAGGNLVTATVDKFDDLEAVIATLRKDVEERRVGAVLEAVVV
ncbi:acetolactate synthase [Lasiodiplodia theobromae]|nr:acetolactate synthase [Lasiodiplodia theobromae]